VKLECWPVYLSLICLARNRDIWALCINCYWLWGTGVSKIGMIFQKVSGRYEFLSLILLTKYFQDVVIHSTWNTTEGLGDACHVCVNNDSFDSVVVSMQVSKSNVTVLLCLMKDQVLSKNLLLGYDLLNISYLWWSYVLHHVCWLLNIRNSTFAQTQRFWHGWRCCPLWTVYKSKFKKWLSAY
jgi:hypothetical protein